MSTGKRFQLEKIQPVIKQIHEALDPFIVDYMLVGSAGRQEAWIGDIDILVRPRRADYRYMFGSIERLLRSSGEWSRGGTRQMSVKNVFGTGIGLDLFLCHPPAQWGVLAGVRLNPVEFVMWAKTRIDGMGYKRENGTIFDPFGNEVKIPDEKAYFSLLGLDWVPPNQRRELCQHLGLEPYQDYRISG